MNPHTATLTEIRDYLYRCKALKDLSKPMSEMPWAEQQWNNDHCRVVDEWAKKMPDSGLCHPFPPTRDGAASAMPEGWDWERWQIDWVGYPLNNKERFVTTLHTSDEITDRYRLAALCVQAEKENKHGN